MSAAPRRFLFLVHESLFFLTHRLPLGVAAQEMGFEVHVAAPYMAGFVEDIRERGFHYHDIPLDRGSLSPAAELKLALAFHRLIREVRPDIVHAVGMKPVLYGGVIARLLRVPALVPAVTGLGFLFLREGWRMALVRAIVRRLYRLALGHPNARIIFQNPDDLGLFVDGNLVDPARTVMIKGCGPDVNVFVATPEPEGEVVVMFPARIIGDKGVHEFVEAARLLKAEGLAARFVLVGRNDPGNRTNVEESEIRGWEESGLVEWWGFHEDMPETLAKAHVICTPSYREGLPRGLVEAAACARPIVTADVPGCREVVRDGDNGLLVPARDGVATAAAIRRLVEDGALRRRMGARGREIAVAEFSEERFVAEHREVYRAVLEAIGTAA